MLSYYVPVVAISLFYLVVSILAGVQSKDLPWTKCKSGSFCAEQYFHDFVLNESGWIDSTNFGYLTGCLLACWSVILCFIKKGKFWTGRLPTRNGSKSSIVTQKWEKFNKVAVNVNWVLLEFLNNRYKISVILSKK